MLDRARTRPRPQPAQIATREDLASALTGLREAAGLTIRDLAKQSRVPAGTVSGYFSGRHVPPASALPQVLAVLAACGVEDPHEIDDWTEAIARVRRTPGRRAADAPVPYRGLASFQVDDAAWFFGREELTSSLVALVESSAEPVVVVGPSGSGKSSLVRAGLVPAWTLRPADLDATGTTTCGASHPSRTTTGGAPDETGTSTRGAPDPTGTPDRSAVVLTPGADPAAALRSALAELQRDDTLVVVDQLEEIFTAADAGARADFVEALRQVPAGTRVVLVLRSDFYPQAIGVPGLVPALQTRQLVVGPMSAEELRRAVVEPAARAGVDLEPGFADVLLRDLRPRATHEALAHDAGTLPLLSHALLATWERGQRRRLATADYEAIGGIDGAVAQTAEDVYSGLDDAQRETTRRLFLRLVHVVDGLPVARRRVPWEELTGVPAGSGDHPAGSRHAVLERFVSARLVTADDGHAELAHEALLWAWPRLHGWVEADRDGVRVRRVLAETAALWRDNGRDPGLLHRGSPLDAAREWTEDGARAGELTPLEREFLDASVAAAHATARAQARHTRRLRALASGLTVLLVLAVGLGGLAYRQRQWAEDARDLAVSRELALSADRLAGSDLALARQLALAAWDVSPTDEARSSVLSLSATPMVTRLLGDGRVLQAVDLDASGHLLAAAGASGHVVLVDVADPSHPRRLTELTGAGGTLFAVAVSPDGSRVAAAGDESVVRVWDVRDPSHLAAPTVLKGATSTVYSLAWSPDGSTLVGGSADGTVRIWRDGVASSLAVGTAPVQSVTLSRDGRLLAAGSADGSVRTWRVDDWSAPVPVATRKDAGGPVFSVAFSPDASMLAAGSKDRKIWLYDVSVGGELASHGAALSGPTSWVNAVTFSHDGRRLAAGSSDDKVWLWDVPSGEPAGQLPHPSPITGVRFSGDDSTLVSVANDGATRLWHLPPPLLVGAAASIFSIATPASGTTVAVGASDGVRLWEVGRDRVPIALSGPLRASATGGSASAAIAITRDGRLLAAGNVDGSVSLWDVSAPRAPRRIAVLTGPVGLVETVTFSPDGRWLVAGGDDASVWLWEVGDGSSAPTRRVGPLQSASNYVSSLAWSPTAPVLAVGSVDKTVHLWDVSEPGSPHPIGTPLTGPRSYVNVVAISPDGRVLAAGSDDRTIRLWDISDPARPRTLGQPLHGPATSVYGLTFGPTGHHLVAGTVGGEVWRWDVSDPAHPEPIGALTGPSAATYAVAVSPDGRTLFGGGAEHIVRMWSTDPAVVRDRTCAADGDGVTRDEWATYAPDVPFLPPCDGGSPAAAAKAAAAAG